MANPPPVVVVEKKRGFGCCGCGCLILVALAVLFFGLLGFGGYVAYKKALALTSTTPATIPSFDGGDAVYQSATQKRTDFNQALQHHQPATLRLTGDEINTLLARDPNLSANNIHIFVTLIADQAKIETSVPLSVLQWGVLKDRYVNGETTFSLAFESNEKTLNFLIQNLRIGDKSIPHDTLPTLQTELNPALNTEFKKNAPMKSFLQQAKSIEIKDSELVIEIE